MQRSPDNLCNTEFDLVVVGAGIHGACVARDAALRGLRVALIDRGDFGNATSHNSFKIVHGGLRYLQHLDFPRVRQSIGETRFWRQAAPHLVRPLQFVIPTRGHLTRGREALWAGLRMHQVLGFDRNRDVPSQRHMPAGHVMSRAECLRLIPGLEDARTNGGAAWFDGQMQDSDRILTECVLSAVAAGAEVANYVEVTGFLRSGADITGIKAIDLIDRNELEIRSRCIVNAAGPWVATMLHRGGTQSKVASAKGLVKGINLVTRKILDDHAIGVASKRASDAVVGNSERLYFITPWRDKSLVGTTHFEFGGDPDSWEVDEEEISDFIDEINAAYPRAELSLQDVCYCYSGLTPSEASEKDEAKNRSRHSDIFDHGKLDGVGGIVSIVGVKYTTARLVAEHAVDLVFRKLGRTPPPCVAKSRPLPGAAGFDGWQAMEERLTKLTNGGANDNVRFLVESAGIDPSGRSILDGLDEQVTEEALYRERCRVALRDEMSVRLSDLVFRRTDLAQRGAMSRSRIGWCADLMTAEHGWSAERRQAEVDAVGDECRRRFVRLQVDPAAAASDMRSHG